MQFLQSVFDPRTCGDSEEDILSDELFHEIWKPIMNNGIKGLDKTHRNMEKAST